MYSVNLTTSGNVTRNYNINQSLPSITYTSSIGHLVWHDSNADGIWAGQSLEPGIAGVEVILILNGAGIHFNFTTITSFSEWYHNH